MAEKLAEPSLKDLLVSVFLDLSEKVTPSAVVKELCAAAIASKSPKAAAEITDSINSILVAFGEQLGDLKPIVSFSVQLLNSKDAAPVKQATKALLSEVYKRVGNPLRSQLTDLKPAIVTVFSKEFDRLGNVKPAAPSRKVKARANGYGSCLCYS